MGSDFAGSVEFQYLGTPDEMTRMKIFDKALDDWRTFIEDPEADLPWNSSVNVTTNGSLREATVVIRWERASR